MKTTISFVFEDDEESRLRKACNFESAFFVLSHLALYLRNRLKYEELPDDVRGALQAVSDTLWEKCGEYCIDPLE